MLRGIFHRTRGKAKNCAIIPSPEDRSRFNLPPVVVSDQEHFLDTTCVTDQSLTPLVVSVSLTLLDPSLTTATEDGESLMLQITPTSNHRSKLTDSLYKLTQHQYSVSDTRINQLYLIIGLISWCSIWDL